MPELVIIILHRNTGARDIITEGRMVTGNPQFLAVAGLESKKKMNFHNGSSFGLESEYDIKIMEYAIRCKLYTLVEPQYEGKFFN
jgi:hypothetical protein